jgi:dipeptidyl aminopeptidase/acylaminoacyl peptidase
MTIGRPRSVSLLLGLIVPALIRIDSGPALAQDAPSALAQARARLGRFDNTVFRTGVRAHWLPDGKGFWYRVETGPESREYLRVDAGLGTRAPAFDHAKLAEALAQATGKPVDSHRLSLEELEFPEDRVVRFRFEGSLWDCRLDTYDVSEIKGPAAAGDSDDATPTVSRPGGEETSLTFQNRSTGAVELFWVDLEGQRQSYGTLAPGESRNQHTFAHHVWVVVDATGRLLRRVEGAMEPKDVVIDGSVKLRDSGDRPRRGRNRPRGAVDRPESPDGRWRAFFRDHNLWVEDRSAEGADREFALTTDGSAVNAYGGPLLWSPDSQALFVLQTEPAQEHKVTFIESSPASQVQPKTHSIDYLKPGDRIAHPRPRLFRVAEKRSLPIDESLFPNPWGIDEFHWSSDSKSIQFLYNQRGHQVLRLLAADADTGAVRPLIDESSKTFIDYAGKLFLHRVTSTGELLWMSERDGWNHLWLYDGETGMVKNQVTRGEWVVRRVEYVDEEARRVWFLAGGVQPGQDPYYLHLCRVNFDGSGFVILTEGDGTHTVDFSPDRRYFLDTYSRVDQPPVCELRSSEDGHRIVTLEEADATRLYAAGWTAPERFEAPARDGTTPIYGVLLKPTSFDPVKRYPVVESIYAGPQAAFVPKGWGPARGLQEMAELGFIVVQIDGLGTSFRSKAFHDVCWKNLADAGLPDRVGWIQAAARQRPWMDLDRVGVYGGSAGGQNALRALLDHGDFYKVGVADCGCHDNRMDKIWWNELWMGWPVGPEYEASSNVTAAAKLTGKLLLVAGEMDQNVDPASTMQVVHALVKADKDFDLLIIPGQGHGAAETPYGRRRRAEFLLRHLGPPEEAASARGAE